VIKFSLSLLWLWVDFGLRRQIQQSAAQNLIQFYIRAEKYSEKKLRLIDGVGPVSSVFIYVTQQQIPAAGASLASLSLLVFANSNQSPSAGCALRNIAG